MRSPFAARRRHEAAARRAVAARFAIALAAFLGVIATALSSSPAAAPRADDAAFPSPATPISGPTERFRLGDAARPFAWSTAVADLNADGKPDFAILDRAASAARGAFELDLELSTGVAQHLSLESVDGPLTVVVEDIDDDRDLDIVVTPALSHEVVAVWVNDGSGRFSRAALDIASRRTRRAALSAGDSVQSTGAALMPRWIAIDPATASESSVAPATIGCRFTRRDSRVVAARSISSLGSRAPPAAL